MSGLALGLRIGLKAAGLGPIVETTPLYSEDFNAYSDNTILVGGTPNWTALSSTGATSNEKFNAAVISGKLTQRASGAVGDFTTVGSATASGKYLLSPPVDLGSANHFIQFTAKAFTSGNGVRMSLLASDEVSRLDFRVNTGIFASTKFLGAGSAPVSLGGASALGPRMVGGVHPNPKPFAVDDVFYVRTYNGILRAYRNGAPIGATSFDVSSMAGTRIGISTYGSEFRDVDNVYAGPLPGDLTIANSLAAYPRIQGLGGYEHGAADVAISGTYAGTVTGLQWALFDPEVGFNPMTGAGLLKTWARVASPTIAGGNWSGTVRVPCGLNGRKPYSMAVRAENNTNLMASQYGIFYVCYTVLLIGQSNNYYFAQQYTSGDLPNHPGGTTWYSGLGASAQLTQWATSASTFATTPAAAAAITYELAEDIGLPVYVLNVAVAGNGAADIGPGGSQWANIQSWIATYGGAFDIIDCSQGEAEINATGSTQANLWKSRWLTNIPAYRALSGQPSGTVIPVLFQITGRYSSSVSADKVANSNIVRKAQAEIVSELDDAYLGSHGVGLVTTDGVHFDQTTNGRWKQAKRKALSIKKRLGLSAYDGRGPYATGATRSGATVTVVVDLNGADSIAGTGLTGWEAATDSAFASPVTVNSADVSGDDVVIVLASDPGAPVYIRNYAGHDPADTTWVVGTYADASTIEMEPVVNPILTAS